MALLAGEPNAAESLIEAAAPVDEAVAPQTATVPPDADPPPPVGEGLSAPGQPNGDEEAIDGAALVAHMCIGPVLQAKCMCNTLGINMAVVPQGKELLRHQQTLALVVEVPQNAKSLLEHNVNACNSAVYASWQCAAGDVSDKGIGITIGHAGHALTALENSINAMHSTLAWHSIQEYYRDGLTVIGMPAT